MTQARFVLAVLMTATIAGPVIRAAQLTVVPGTAVDPNTKFEVASIKPSDPAGGQSLMRVMPGQFTATGVTARLLLRQVFRVPDYELIGAPAWADSDRYAIVAKAPSGTPANANQMMVLNLLKDRFKLILHTETREMPIHTLVLARTDGRLGPGIKPSSPECQAEVAARIAGGNRGASAGGPRAPAGPPDLRNPPCGMSGMGLGIAGGGGVTVAVLVQFLSQLTGRPVVDKTGLTGIYDVTLRYAPDSAQALGPPGGAPPGAALTAADPDAPNLYTAVQEQLGLKLDNQRGSVDVIVIDRIEKPVFD